MRYTTKEITIFVILVSIIVCVCTVDFNSDSRHKRAAIEECELNLPRTEHCVMTAVPESEIEK